MNQVTSKTQKQVAVYTQGPIQGHVLRISGVMIVGFLAMTGGQLIEMFYLGQVGKLELAAITFTFPIAMSLNSFARGIGLGGAALIAQSMGDDDRHQAALTMTHCFLLVLLFSLLVTFFGQFGAEGLFAFMGASGEVLVLANDYAAIWLLGFPMMSIAMSANAMIRSFGDATFPGLVMSSAPLVQVAVGPVLIFGMFGVPSMGMEGAAWAFVIGTSAQMFLVFYWYVVKERLFTRALQGFALSTRQILYVGIPASGTNLIQPLSIAVVTWLLAGYGDTVVAGFGVASRIEAVVGMVAFGIATSVVPLVGQNWGAGEYTRVNQALNTCYIGCLGWGLLAAIIMWLGAPFFVNVINSDPTLVDTAVTFLYIIPISIGFMGLIVVSTHSFNALRKPIPALLLSVARLLVVYIPMALIAGHYFGFVGVFAATSVTNVVVGVFAVWWNRQTIKNAIAARAGV